MANWMSLLVMRFEAHYFREELADEVNSLSVAAKIATAEDCAVNLKKRKTCEEPFGWWGKVIVL